MLRAMVSYRTNLKSFLCESYAIFFFQQSYRALLSDFCEPVPLVSYRIILEEMRSILLLRPAVGIHRSTYEVPRQY